MPDQLPDSGHSLPPAMETHLLDFVGGQSSSDFRRAEGLWWLSLGEELVELLLQYHCHEDQCMRCSVVVSLVSGISCGDDNWSD